MLIAPKCYPVFGAEAIVNMKMLQAFSTDKTIKVDLVSRKYADEMYPTEGIGSYGVNIDNICVVESCNKLNLRTTWQTIMSLFKFGCFFKGCVWAYEALPVVQKLIKENIYDFVITKNSPSFLLGAFLHDKGLPWVASWNDPFPWGFYPAPYGRGAGHKPTFIERMMLKQMMKADYHVFPSSNLMNHMNQYLPFDKSKARVIPHVVLQNQSAEIVRTQQIVDQPLSIIHSGNLGAPRDPHSFFDAVEYLLRENRDIKLKVTVLGKISKDDMPGQDSYPLLSKCFYCLPPVSYTESLKLLENYNLACVIEAPCKEGEAVFLPTKVTDFMQVGIPILSVSPKGGVLHNMYNKGEIGYFGDVHDSIDIKNILQQAWEDYTHNGLKQNKIDNSFLEDSVRQTYLEIGKLLS